MDSSMPVAGVLTPGDVSERKVQQSSRSQQRQGESNNDAVIQLVDNHAAGDPFSVRPRRRGDAGEDYKTDSTDG